MNAPQLIRTTPRPVFERLPNLGPGWLDRFHDIINDNILRPIQEQWDKPVPLVHVPTGDAGHRLTSEESFSGLIITELHGEIGCCL